MPDRGDTQAWPAEHGPTAESSKQCHWQEDMEPDTEAIPNGRDQAEPSKACQGTKHSDINLNPMCDPPVSKAPAASSNIDAKDWATLGPSASTANKGRRPQTPITPEVITHARPSNEAQIKSWIKDPSVHTSGPNACGGTPRVSFSVGSSSTPTSKPLGPGNRRPNPKSLQVRRERQRTANLRQGYTYIAQVNGIRLYRLCDSVPYLLGPKEYLEALQRLSDVSSILPPIKGDRDDEVLEENSLSVKDRSFALLLTILSTPEEQREAAADWILRGTTSYRDSLVLWKDVGTGRPKGIILNFFEFTRLLFACRKQPNPALEACDGPQVVTPWSDIVTMLQEREINTEHIDRALYRELTTVATRESLDERLSALQEASKKGELKTRKEKARKGSRYVPNTTRPASPPESEGPGFYTLRFSHKYPKGKPIDPSDRPKPITKMSELSINARTRPTIREIGESLKEKKQRWSETRWGRACKISVGVVLTTGFLVIALIFGYFHIGQKARGRTR